GHVGLPLALTLADAGCQVTIVDLNAVAVESVNAGRIGFVDRGAEALLRRTIGNNLRATTQNDAIRACDVVICVVGTPIDEHLNPEVGKLLRVIAQLTPYMNSAQLFVLRSTVYPGATHRVGRWLEERVPGVDIAFCPERVAQGFAVEEIRSLPQIVSGT